VDGDRLITAVLWHVEAHIFTHEIHLMDTISMRQGKAPILDFPYSDAVKEFEDWALAVSDQAGIVHLVATHPAL
jgi:hypothetical protein